MNFQTCLYIRATWKTLKKLYIFPSYFQHIPSLKESWHTTEQWCYMFDTNHGTQQRALKCWLLSSTCRNSNLSSLDCSWDSDIFKNSPYELNMQPRLITVGKELENGMPEDRMGRGEEYKCSLSTSGPWLRPIAEGARTDDLYFWQAPWVIPIVRFKNHWHTKCSDFNHIFVLIQINTFFMTHFS